MRPISIRNEIKKVADDKLTEAVSSAIRRADPSGLIAAGAPSDEYDGEVARIVEQLKAAAPLQDQPGLRAIMVSVFEQSLGTGSVGTLEAYDQAATEVWLDGASAELKAG